MRGMGLTGRNIPKTNVAEREAAKSFYRLTIAPAATLALARLNLLGPLGSMARYSALTTATSNTAASGFADLVAGKDTRDKE